MPEPTARPCRRCGGPIHEPDGAGRGAWVRFCSDACRDSPATPRSITQLPPGAPLPDGMPRRYRAHNGYIRLRWYLGPGRYVETYEHRVEGDHVTTAEHVHHINHDKSDNSPANLRYLTAEEHAEHHRAHPAPRRPARKKGAPRPLAYDHGMILDMLDQGLSHSAIAAKVGCSIATVSRYRHRAKATGPTPTSS